MIRTHDALARELNYSRRITIKERKKYSNYEANKMKKKKLFVEANKVNRIIMDLLATI
jgi:hypothetical protein